MKSVARLLVCLLLASCSAEPEVDPSTSLPGPPATKEGTLSVEGAEERVALQQYASPESFALPFSTFIPDELTAEPLPSDEGDGVRFVARFGGVRDENAKVQLVVHPAGTTEELAREVVRSVAESYGPVRGSTEVEPTDRFPWAVAQFRFSGEGMGSNVPVVGAVGLGHHAGRWFHIVVQHPEEMGDGFPPRARIVLDQLRWADGTPLRMP